MRNLVTTLAVSLLSTVTFTSAQAPPVPAPPKEVDQLRSFEGTWMCTGRAPEGPLGPARDVRTKVTVRKELGGFWYAAVIEEMPSKQNSHPLRGRGFWSFDPAQKKFVSLWVDNYGSWSTQKSSGWEGDKMNWLGEGTLGDKAIGVRDAFTKKGAEFHHLGELRVGDKWFVVQDESCKKVGI